jgi:hypothetical protein
MEEQARLGGRCTQQGCDAARSGTCIDGLKIDDCSHFVIGEPEPEAVEPPSVAAEPKEELISCGPGPALSIAQADAFLRARPAHVIAFVGVPDVGKTTLMSSMYELARRGLMAELGFAGTETMRGFEERCHLSRAASGGDVADTRRTSRRSPLTFLHLNLASKRSGGLHDFLISDRTGEDFDAVIDEPGRCTSLPELLRSNCISILVDGSALADAGKLHAHINKARLLFMSLNQHGLLGPGKRIQLVLTKWDLLSRSQIVHTAVEIFADLTEELRARLPDGAPLTAHKIASRRSTEAVRYGAGIEELIAAWLPPPASIHYTSPSYGQLAFDNEYDGLMRRFAAQAPT